MFRVNKIGVLPQRSLGGLSQTRRSVVPQGRPGFQKISPSSVSPFATWTHSRMALGIWRDPRAVLPASVLERTVRKMEVEALLRIPDELGIPAKPYRHVGYAPEHPLELNQGEKTALGRLNGVGVQIMHDWATAVTIAQGETLFAAHQQWRSIHNSLAPLRTPCETTGIILRRLTSRAQEHGQAAWMSAFDAGQLALPSLSV